MLQGLNAADSIVGAPGDVMCLNETGKIVYAIEVKDRTLTLSDVRSSTGKARALTDPLENLLFVAPGIRNDEKEAVHASIETAWVSGLNISQISVIDLANVAFTLLSEEWRSKFLREIRNELDRRGNHMHRRVWHDLLLDSQWYDIISNIDGKGTFNEREL